MTHGGLSEAEAAAGTVRESLARFTGPEQCAAMRGLAADLAQESRGE